MSSPALFSIERFAACAEGGLLSARLRPSGLVLYHDADSCSFWWPFLRAITKSSGFLPLRNGRASLASRGSTGIGAFGDHPARPLMADPAQNRSGREATQLPTTLARPSSSQSSHPWNTRGVSRSSCRSRSFHASRQWIKLRLLLPSSA